MRIAKRSGRPRSQAGSECAGGRPHNAALAASAKTGAAAPVCSRTSVLHDASCGTGAPCTTTTRHVCSGTTVLHDASCGTGAPCTTCNAAAALRKGASAAGAPSLDILPKFGAPSLDIPTGIGELRKEAQSEAELHDATVVACLEDMGIAAEADDKAGIALHPPRPDTLWQFHVVYSVSYAVPVLLFRVSDTGTALTPCQWCRSPKLLTFSYNTDISSRYLTNDFRDVQATNKNAYC